MTQTQIEREQLRSHFTTELASALGHRELRTGRETLRDQSGRRIGQRWIVSTWAAVIEPSYMPWLGAAAIHGDDGQARAVVLLGTEELPSRRIGPVTLQPKDDSVLSALSEIELVEPVKSITLDGVSYSWTVVTGALRTTLSFANPSATSVKRLETCLQGFVQMVARAAGADPQNPIIQGWIQSVEKFVRR